MCWVYIGWTASRVDFSRGLPCFRIFMREACSLLWYTVMDKIIEFFRKRNMARIMSDSKHILFARNLICICIEDNKNADYQGLLYHQYADDPISFDGTADLMVRMEALFDEWDFPQRGLAARKFDKKDRDELKRKKTDHGDKLPIDIISEKCGVRNVQNKKGTLGTFVVQVVYRQDASWQGHVIIKEKDEQLDFNSALELIRIIDRTVSG